MANRTFLEIQDQLLRELEEDPASPVFHTRSIVKVALNDAYRALAVDTEFHREDVSIVTTASTAEYNLLDTDEDIISIGRIQNDDTLVWLRGTTLSELEANRRNFIEVEGPPERVLPRTPFQITLFPVPSTTSALSAQVATVPAQLSADGDQTVTLIEEFDRALMDHAKAFLYAQEREWQKAEGALQDYTQAAGKIRTWVKRRGSARKDVIGAN